LLFVRYLVVRMRPDYFVSRTPSAESWFGKHPAARIAFYATKNLLGVFLVLAGIVLAVPTVPGQGLLTILIGLTLLNFPGKRRLELWIVRLRPVLRAINWMRDRAGQAPLILPPKSKRGKSGSSA
jgi:hypothetical protein